MDSTESPEVGIRAPKIQRLDTGQTSSAQGAATNSISWHLRRLDDAVAKKMTERKALEDEITELVIRRQTLKRKIAFQNAECEVLEKELAVG